MSVRCRRASFLLSRTAPAGSAEALPLVRYLSGDKARLVPDSAVRLMQKAVD